MKRKPIVILLCLLLTFILLEPRNVNAAWQGSLPSPLSNAMHQGYLYGEPKDSSTAHTGVDFPCSQNTPVKAIASGTVIFQGEQTGYGKVAVVQFPHPIYPGVQVYQFNAHLDHFESTTVPRAVNVNDVIAYSGNTGAYSYHLHLEIRVGQNSRLGIRNPEGFLARSTNDGYGGFYGALKHSADGTWARKHRVRLQRTDGSPNIKPESGFGWAPTYFQFINAGNYYFFPDETAYGRNFYTGRTYANQFYFKFYNQDDVYKGQITATVPANSDIDLYTINIPY